MSSNWSAATAFLAKLGAWPSALLATLLISAAPICLLSVFSLTCTRNGKMPKLLMKFMLAFAIGGLLGDSFLHLIPHALMPHDHSHGHSHSHDPVQPLIVHGLDHHDHDHRDHAHADVAATAHHHEQHSGEKAGHSHLHEHGKEGGEHHHDHHHHDHSHDEHGHEHHEGCKHGNGHDHEHSHSHSHDSHSHSHGSHSHSHSHGSHSHSHDSHSHEDSHAAEHARALRVGLGFLSGMLAFFLVEKAQRLGIAGSHGHQHSHGEEEEDEEDENSHDHSATEEEAKISAQSGGELRQRRKGKKAGDGTAAAQQSGEERREQQASVSARAAANLSIFGDFFHNVTDGMALAAAFLASPQLGLSTTIAVLLHEVPHEVGDFAVLLHGGYSVPRAIAMQLVTALGALAGCVLVLVGSSAAAVSDFILPITGGGFVYIALASLVPELMRGKSTITSTILEAIGLALGVGLMALIALFEEH